MEGMHIQKATKILLLCRINMFHAIVTRLELAGVSRPNSGVGHRSYTRSNTEFLLYVRKNTGKNAELKVLDVNSLVLEHVRVSETPKEPQIYRAHSPNNPCVSSLCCTEMIRTEKNRMFLNQRGGCMYTGVHTYTPQGENQRNKNIWPMNKFSIK